MNKIIFIHIGLPKTGTTSIQTGLVANKELLTASGIHLPKSGKRSVPDFAVSEKIFHDIRNNVTSPIMSEIIKEIHKSEHTSFILSAEVFSYLKGDMIQRFIGLLSNVAQCKIVIYLRRQDKYIQSAWAQRVVTGVTYESLQDDIESILEYQHFLKYDSFVDSWAKVVGKENLLVSTFEEMILSQQHPLNHFLTLCGFGFESVNLDFQTDQNKSPSLRTLELVRPLVKILRNDLKVPVDTNRWLLASVLKKFNQILTELGWNNTKLNALTPEISQQIMDSYNDANKQVALDYFDRDHLFSELEPVIGDDNVESLNEDLSWLDTEQLLLILIGYLKKDVKF